MRVGKDVRTPDVAVLTCGGGDVLHLDLGVARGALFVEAEAEVVGLRGRERSVDLCRELASLSFDIGRNARQD